MRRTLRFIGTLNLRFRIVLRKIGKSTNKMKRREEKLEEKNLINKSNKPKKGLQNQVLKKQF